MITENATIKNLFLIRNELEYQAVIKLAQSNCLLEYEILTIKDEHPYLVNDCASLEKVSTWQDWGVVDPGFSRYWLNEYQAIDDIISCEITDDEKYNNDVMQSRFFKFGLNWLLGRRYYDVINALDIFFRQYKPTAIYFGPEDSFICHLLLSFARAYKFQCGKLV